MTRPTSPLLALGGVFGGAAASAVAWVFLVGAAIDFGAQAKDGRALAWLFMTLATLGAIACLALGLILLSRGLSLLGLLPRGKRPAASGGHRRSGK